MSFAIALSGGERVVAWEVGVLAGLTDGGIDARRAEVVLGTSAGALVAATAPLAVAAGRERGRAVAAQIRPRRAA